MSHTMKLPLTVDPSGIDILDAGGTYIAVADAEVAEHIVRCVNSRDALRRVVAVAEPLVALLEADKPITHGQIRTLRAAIALAEGDEP